ncbi:MAG: hypothetical protein JNM98_06200 [Rhodocyclaceae bacterium]|nr:hypothetical protein [Rhodocyclaceae bacterium]
MGTKNWKGPATSLRAAFQSATATALKERRRNAERMAEMLGTSTAAYYKWLEDLRMPVALLPAFEEIAGSHAVSEYLATQAHMLCIPVPRGRKPAADDIQAVQGTLHEAVGALMDFAAGRRDVEATMSALNAAMSALAYEREQVRRAGQPELDFGGAANG